MTTAAAIRATPLPPGWRTGFCETPAGAPNHRLCPVEVRRPAPNPPAACACPCHHTPQPYDLGAVLTAGLTDTRIVAEWFGDIPPERLGSLARFVTEFPAGVVDACAVNDCPPQAIAAAVRLARKQADT